MKHYAVTQAKSPFRQFQRTQKSQVYEAIAGAGPKGITRPDIAQKVGLQPDRISFYLSDLRRAGYIDVVGDTSGGAAQPNIANMPPAEAKLAAMLALENALIATVKAAGGATPEQERGFVKYTKIKEHVLHNSTPEGQVAVRMAVMELVKLVF